MSSVTVQIILMAWSIMIMTLLQQVFKKIVALYEGVFTKNSVSAAMMLGFLASVTTQIVGAVTIGATVSSFFMGLMTGTLVYGSSLLLVKLLVSVNKDAAINVYQSAKSTMITWYVKAAIWWANRKGDQKRREAERTVRKAA
jgi:hypothetical protein